MTQILRRDEREMSQIPLRRRASFAIVHENQEVWLDGTSVARDAVMGYEHLKRRTFQFAVDTIRTARPLLQHPLGRHLVGQVIRSGSSVGANYDAACNARSRADFAAKVSIVAEEASETGFWFRLFVELELLQAKAAGPIVTEARELASIAMASAQTAKGRRHPPAPQRAESRNPTESA